MQSRDDVAQLPNELATSSERGCDPAAGLRPSAALRVDPNPGYLHFQRLDIR
jgi:hypothetical protein